MITQAILIGVLTAIDVGTMCYLYREYKRTK